LKGHSWLPYHPACSGARLWTGQFGGQPGGKAWEVSLEKRLFMAKLLLLALLLLVMQFSVGRKLFQRWDPREHANCDALLAREVDAIYMGDSSVFYVSDEDTDKADLPDMLQELLPEYSVGGLFHHGYQLPVYASYTDYIASHARRPRLLIIPVNMRSFMPVWRDHPYIQFRRETLYLDNYNSAAYQALFAPMVIFDALDLIPFSLEEFNAIPIHENGRIGGVMRDYLPKGKAKLQPGTVATARRSFELTYLQPITSNHVYFDALRRIVTRCRDNAINVAFYIVPIDFQEGEKLLGARFRDELQGSIDKVTGFLREEDAFVNDLGDGVDTDNFYYVSNVWPDEHLNAEGRRFVAEQMAAYIKRHGLLNARANAVAQP
jgi:hypothetical protein